MVVRGMPHQRIPFIGMFEDARKLPAGATVEADICIIGGGAAGITLACDLAGSNLTVALQGAERKRRACPRRKREPRPFARADRCRRRRMRSSRRAFLAATGAAALLPLSWRGGASTGATDADRLRAAIANPASAAALGRAYLARFPGEADRDRIAAAILASLAAPPARDASALRAPVRARIRGDFRAGATVTLDGWILSRTEARLAALWA
jgi:choline dehydrogenase-like flavoprotein